MLRIYNQSKKKKKLRLRFGCCCICGLSCTDTNTVLSTYGYRYEDTVFLKNLCKPIWISGIKYDTGMSIGYRYAGQNGASCILVCGCKEEGKGRIL